MGKKSEENSVKRHVHAYPLTLPLVKRYNNNSNSNNNNSNNNNSNDYNEYVKR